MKKYMNIVTSITKAYILSCLYLRLKIAVQNLKCFFKKIRFKPKNLFTFCNTSYQRSAMMLLTY